MSITLLGLPILLAIGYLVWGKGLFREPRIRTGTIGAFMLGFVISAGMGIEQGAGVASSLVVGVLFGLAAAVGITAYLFWWSANGGKRNGSKLRW